MSYTPPLWNDITEYNEEPVDPLTSFDNVDGFLEDEIALHRVKIHSIENTMRAIKLQSLSQTGVVRSVTLWKINKPESATGTFDATFDATFI